MRPGPPPRPAHEIALEKLDRLGQYGFLENADNRPFYFAVSEVIREYLGARFGFDSLELTTDELVRRAAARAPGASWLLGRDRGLAAACDLVKFAKISPRRRRGARHAGDGDPDRRRRRARAPSAGRRRRAAPDGPQP